MVPLDDIGVTHRKPNQNAYRTNDSYESHLQSRPKMIPSVGGMHTGVGYGRKVGAPAVQRVVHTEGKNVAETYPELPEDVYRVLAENERHQGIGSKLQVRF